MARKIRQEFSNGRRRKTLTTCLFVLGLFVLGVMTGAQIQRDKKTANPPVTIVRSSLAVYLSVLPGKQQSDLELRVRTEPQVKNPPEVEFQDLAGGMVRIVNLEANKDNADWVGTITQVDPFGVGYIHVIATDESGVAQRHGLRFATRGTVKGQPNVIYSVDGQFAFVILAGEAPADSRFLVSTLEIPETPLPEGVKIEAGPFQIVPMKQLPDYIQASVAIFLTGNSPNSGPAPRYQVWQLKPKEVAWEILPTTIAADGRNAQALVSRLGMFILASDRR